MGVDPRVIERIGASLRDARAQAQAATSDAARASARSAPVASILAQAATLYGAKPDEERTPPTGFDPAAAMLFEALIEGAFLVANADGEFDADERAAFEQVVLAASGERVTTSQLAALVAELGELLAQDGLGARIAKLTETITKSEQKDEVLRVAALIAQVSGGVSDDELGVMTKLAQGFGLDEAVVRRAIDAAEHVLRG
jgi:tellurite resistance protein